MQERRKITNLVLALGAVALAATAQGRFAAGEVGDALILYLVAAIAFIYACRPWEKVEAAETSGDGHDVAEAEPPAEPVLSLGLSSDLGRVAEGVSRPAHRNPWRLRMGIALLFLAALCSFLSLRSFGRQGGSPGAWGLYLASLVLFVAAFYAWEENRAVPLAPPGRQELILLATICAIGVFLRFYQLQSIPFGLFFDEATNGLDAVRVIQERVYPVYFEANYGRGALFIYLLALSFKLVGTGILAMRLVAAVLGVLTILAFYFLFRQLFGPGLGLVGAYLIATSRWHVNFSRVVFDAVLLPLLAALSFYFLFKGLGVENCGGTPPIPPGLRRRCSQRRTDFLWGGLALGLGLHTYAAFRLIPLVIALFFLYKILTERGFVRRSGLGVAIFVLASFMVFAPLGQYTINNWKAFNARSKAASILTKRDEPDLAKALWNNTRAHLLMFNYLGDRNGRHNLPGEPMLDFVTAVLFALGLGYSLYRWREPRSFFFLACFVVLLLGGILSVDFEAPQALRAIGTLLAACFFACLTLERLWMGCQRAFGSRAGLPALAVIVPLLVYSGWANFHTYFYRQARDFAVWNAFSTPETLTAQAVKAAAGHYDFYLTSLYNQHPTLRFIAPNVTGCKVWDTSGNLPIRESGERPLLILLDAEKRADFLEAQRYYPDAGFEEISPPFGGPTVLYTIRLTGDDLKNIQGLMAYYYRNEEWEGGVALEYQEGSALSRVEGSLDLNWPDEAPWVGPFSVEWRGVLYAPQYGLYLLKLEAPAEAQLYLDENLLLDGRGVMTQEITLAKGNHALRVRAVGAAGRLRLQWRPPGGEESLVPAWALYRPPVTNNGLLGNYYQNLNWAGPPALARIDPALSMYFHVTPLPRPYTVEWQGMISIPYAGVYAFGLESIDDSHLYLDDRLVVEATEPNVYSEGSIELTAGFHDIRLRYTDRSGHSHINLYWTPPGQGRQIVPSQNLYPPQGSYAQAIPAPPPPVAPIELGELALDFVSAWGSQGAGPGEFNEPRDVAVDAEGRLYVADTGNRRVQVFDSEGQFITGWKGGEEEFVEPLALVVDRRGDLYVLDSEPGWIYRFAADGASLGFVLRLSPKGRFAGPDARFFHPRGLAIDEADRLYVADTGGCRVVVYNTAGEYLSQFGWKGGGPGEFLEPTDVALDSQDTLYVVDTSNQRVQHLDPWGGYRTEWPMPASGPYNGPHLALAPDGSLLMTAPEQHQIQRYSPDGTLLGQWGGYGTAAGQFRVPVGLAVDQAGNVYVADTLNHRVQKFALR